MKYDRKLKAIGKVPQSVYVIIPKDLARYAGYRIDDEIVIELIEQDNNKNYLKIYHRN